MKTIGVLITLCVVLVACNTHKSFYCQKTAQFDNWHQCYLSDSVAGCSEDFSKGGCFERPIAYCFTYAIPDEVACFHLSPLGKSEDFVASKEYDGGAYMECLKNFPRTVAMGTQTECNISMDECKANRHKLKYNWGWKNWGNFEPPVLTTCSKFLPTEVIPTN